MARDALFPDGLVRPKAPYSPGGPQRRPRLHRRPGRLRPERHPRRRWDRRADDGRRSRTFQACLLAAGCTLDDVVKVNVFLVDLADFDGFNEVYRAAFAEPYPVRTTVQAGLPGGIRVEIEAVAHLPGAA